MSSSFPSQANYLLSLSWSPNQDNNRSCIKNFDSDDFLVVKYQLRTLNTRFCYYIEQQNQCQSELSKRSVLAMPRHHSEVVASLFVGFRLERI